MEEKNNQVTKALKVFGEVLKGLGIDDYVIATSFEEGDQEAQQVMINGSVNKIAHLILTTEERAPEDVRNHVAMHKLGRVLKKLEEEE